MHSNFYSENVKGRDHLGDQGVDGKVILKLILRKQCMRLWESSDGPLWTFGFHKRRRISWQCEQLSAAQV